MKIFRMASLTTLVAGAALFGSLSFVATGCECIPGHEEDGTENTVCESLKKFTGTPFNQSAVYTAGNEIVIDGINGNIDVFKGGAETEVSVKVKPFSSRGHSREDYAIEDIENDLVVTTEETGGKTVVKVRRKDGAYAGLGADLEVTLPDGFTGGVTIDVGNGFVDADLSGGTPAFTKVVNDGAGDVEIKGAAGALDILGDFDVEVSVATWSEQDGQVKSTGLIGECSLTVPAGTNGSVQATCQDSDCLVEVDGPADWNVQEAAPNSKTVTMGDGNGGNVVMDADDGVSISG